MANCKQTCFCGAHKNFGVKNTTKFGAAKKLLIAQLVADDGVENSIDLASALNTAYFQGLKSNADYSKRYQITPLLEDFAVNVEDDPTVTRASGRILKLRDGAISYEMFFDGKDADNVFFDALKSLECKKIGFNFVDTCSSIAGYKCGTKLSLIPISDNSLMIQKYDATDSESARIKVSFQIDLTGVNNYDVLLGEDLDEVNLLEFDGLYSGDLKAKVSATTTELVVDLQSLSSNVTAIPYEGADTVGNWTMVNNTAAAIVTITSVVESAVIAGRYTFEFPAQTAADSVTLTYLDNVGEIIFTTTLD